MANKIMANKIYGRHEQYIRRLCYDGEKVIDSESFRDLKYLVKDGHIILISGKSGEFAVRMDVIPALFKELKEIAETWGDIKTKKCLL